jgi:hypothetical protein
MTIASDYIDANSKYLLDVKVLAAIEQVSDAAWPALLAGIEELTGDTAEPGYNAEIVWTAETISDFDAARASYWAERGSRVEFNCAGFPAVNFERLQLLRGQPRRNIVVVDLGDRRIMLSK